MDTVGHTKGVSISSTTDVYVSRLVVDDVTTSIFTADQLGVTVGSGGVYYGNSEELDLGDPVNVSACTPCYDVVSLADSTVSFSTPSMFHISLGASGTASLTGITGPTLQKYNITEVSSPPQITGTGPTQ